MRKLGKENHVIIHPSKKKETATILQNILDSLEPSPSIENSVLNHATSYAVIKSGFLQGKLQLNDFVDLLNIVTSASSQNTIYYITNEKRWKDFLYQEELNNEEFRNKRNRIRQIRQEWFIQFDF